MAFGTLGDVFIAAWADVSTSLAGIAGGCSGITAVSLAGATGGDGDSNGRVTTVFRPEAINNLSEQDESGNDNAQDAEEEDKP